MKRRSPASVGELLVTWRQDETKLDETPYIYGLITTPFSSGIQPNYNVHTTIVLKMYM